MLEDFLWVEKYRPNKVADTILPKELKAKFQGYVDKQNIGNMILSGRPGTGKTTVARAMLEEIDADYIIINGSLEGRSIDTLRNEIASFASTVSFYGKRKFIIIDEADYLNPESIQPALRGFIETHSKNCGFILTCNYVNKLIEPLHSRAPVIEFKIPKEERSDLAIQFLNRLMDILKKENITFDKKVLAELIFKYFPDWRKIIGLCQHYSINGTIDSGIFASQVKISELVKMMKEKNFTALRKWVGENSDVDSAAFFREFYDQAGTFFAPASIPQLILTLSDYQYKAAFVADKEINLAAFLLEVMVNCEFK